MGKLQEGHEMYKKERFRDALILYTEALADYTASQHKAAIYNNRVACFLKLGLIKEAIDECGAVLALDCNNKNALLLRAQISISLKNYHAALFDVKRLVELEPSHRYRELEANIRTQTTLETIVECDDEAIADISPPESPSVKALRSCSPITVLPEQQKLDKAEQKKRENAAPPEPKSHHSRVDYSKWNAIGEDLSDGDEEEEEQPQYRYRLRTVGLRAATL